MSRASCRSVRRLGAVPARRDLRVAPVGADRRHPRHRAVRRQPDRARSGRRRLYRRRLSRPPAGPQCRVVRRRAHRGAARAAGHAVRPQHRRRRGQHRHQAPTGVFGVRASAGIGNFGSYKGTCISICPSSPTSRSSSTAFRAPGRDGENPLAGQFGWNFFNRVGGRVAAAGSRSTALPPTSPTISAADENTPFYSQLINYNPLNRVGRRLRSVDELAFRAALRSDGLHACIAPLSPLVVVSGDNRQSGRNRRAAAAERRPDQRLRKQHQIQGVAGARTLRRRLRRRWTSSSSGDTLYSTSPSKPLTRSTLGCCGTPISELRWRLSPLTTMSGDSGAMHCTPLEQFAPFYRSAADRHRCQLGDFADCN